MDDKTANETIIQMALARCDACALDKHGCARNDAHKDRQGCQGFRNVSGIEIVLDTDQEDTKVYRVEAKFGGKLQSVDVWKDRALSTVPIAQAEWRPATVNWGAFGSMRPEYAKLYGEMLVVAAELAAVLDRLVTNDGPQEAKKPEPVEPVGGPSALLGL